jgi:hypothetical protein
MIESNVKMMITASEEAKTRRKLGFNHRKMATCNIGI